MRTRIRFTPLLIGTAFAIAAVWSIPAAHAQTQSTSLAVELAAKKKSKTVRRSAKYRRGYSGRQIACTPAGCHPVPPGCTPTIGFDRWGNPAGFDVVVCR